jgi:eukaryotic-like serine/threonine-protein kinase
VVGSHVSHYRIISQIGAGGMGTVYLAEDTNLKRQVALKFLRSERIGSQDAAVRLLREARAASSRDHPHIATVYEIGTHSNEPFIAMAYYHGETLAARLSRGQMTSKEIAVVVEQIADGLRAAHEAGIVHRDLKPSNIMLTTAGHVKVLDFGIAKVDVGDTATQLTAAGETLGTAAYMSPEQAAGESVDARSDLWSLGVVTYEMLTGQQPFQGTSALGIIGAVMAGAPAPITTLRPDAATELQEIVKQSLVRDRGQRTITAAAVRELAARCHARLTSGKSPSAGSVRAWQRMRIAAAGILLAIAAGGAAWWAKHNREVRWARQEALPEIIRLAGADTFDEAYTLARRVQLFIPEDPLLAEQWRLISRNASVNSDPAGANISFRPYGRSGEPWARSHDHVVERRGALGRLPRKSFGHCERQNRIFWGQLGRRDCTAVSRRGKAHLSGRALYRWTEPAAFAAGS